MCALRGDENMGTWGTTLYSNDTTCDVRDTYMGFLKENLGNQEAFEKTLEEYKELIGDKDEEPLFWFALAETQWKVGRLTPDVKEKALTWIEKDGGIALWEESGVSSSGWKKTLGKLKEKLESPMRSEKKFRKPAVINQNLWNIGDVYAYQIHTEGTKKYGTFGKYVIIQKMGESPHRPLYLKSTDVPEEPLMMRIHVFDKLFEKIPSLEDMEGLRLLPFGHSGHPPAKDELTREALTMNALMEIYKKKDYPESHLFYLGNASVPANKIIKPNTNPTLWNLFGRDCSKSFQRWQGKDYETVEEGIFRKIKIPNEQI